MNLKNNSNNYMYSKEKIKKLCGFINWVDVKDKLPSHQTDVITYSKEFEIRNGRCLKKGSWFVNGYNNVVNVTHWAELPKPPCL